MDGVVRFGVTVVGVEEPGGHCEVPYYPVPRRDAEFGGRGPASSG